jgi:hypothetical protein
MTVEPVKHPAEGIMIDPGIRAVGISWYREQDYPRILKLMIDSDALPSIYSAWKKKAELQERDVQAEGITTFRAIIEPDEFPGWCKAHGWNVDAEGRSAFASEFALLQVKGEH